MFCLRPLRRPPSRNPLSAMPSPPLPLSSRRSGLGVLVAALLCAPGLLYPVFFIPFCWRARALYGGWPPVFHFYKEMEPWTGVFERWDGILDCMVIPSGLLALLLAVPLAAGWRWHRPALRTATLALALLAVSCLLGMFLPFLLLPQGAIDWWYD